jgi:multicomponent Na+:H+ antiporter subunit D
MPELPPVLALLAGAALLPVLPRRAQPVVLLGAPLVALAMIGSFQPGATLTVPFFSYELVLLRADRLAVAFGLVFALMAFLGGLYGLRLSGTGERVVTLLYAGSAIGVVFAGDLLTLFVFWEIKAVASTFLVWARRSPSAGGAGVRYLMVHLFGGTVLLAGIVLHHAQTGSLLIAPFDGGLAAWLVLVGVAVNVALPPLHAWLPDAYPQATVTGAIYMSALTTKSAVLVLMKLFAGWDVLLYGGVFMALYGVVYAVLANDIRQILAYHIVSQVGYMVAGVGMGTELALNGSAAHAFSHILYKALLFMGAGAVIQATGASRLTELGGLGRRMRVVLCALHGGGVFHLRFPALQRVREQVDHRLGRG